MKSTDKFVNYAKAINAYNDTKAAALCAAVLTISVLAHDRISVVGGFKFLQVMRIMKNFGAKFDIDQALDFAKDLRSQLLATN